MPSMQRIFIANRGEIVARVARTAATLGMETVAVAVQGAVPRFFGARSYPPTYY